MDHLRKVHGMNGAEAMSAAARDHPDLLQKYRTAGDEMIAKAADAARPAPVSKAVMAFDDRVEEIAKSRGIPRHAAMTAARQRFADEFEAAYGRQP